MRIPTRATLSTSTPPSSANDGTNAGDYSVLGSIRSFCSSLWRPAYSVPTSHLRFMAVRDNDEQTDDGLEGVSSAMTPTPTVESVTSSGTGVTASTTFVLSSDDANPATTMISTSEALSSSSAPTPSSSSVSDADVTSGAVSDAVLTSTPALSPLPAVTLVSEPATQSAEGLDETDDVASTTTMVDPVLTTTTTTIGITSTVAAKPTGVKVLNLVVSSEPATSTSTPGSASLMTTTQTMVFVSNGQTMTSTVESTYSSAMSQPAESGAPMPIPKAQSNAAISGNNLGAILGSVLGLFFLAVLSLLLVFFVRRRRQRDMRKRLMIQHPADYPDLGSTPPHSIKERDEDLSPALFNFPGPIGYDATTRRSPGSNPPLPNLKRGDFPVPPGGSGPSSQAAWTWRDRTSVASSAFSPWLRRSQTDGDGEASEGDRSSKVARSMRSVGGAPSINVGARLSSYSNTSLPMNVAFPTNLDKIEGEDEESFEKGGEGEDEFEDVDVDGEEKKSEGYKGNHMYLAADASFMDLGCTSSTESLPETNVDNFTSNTGNSLASQQQQSQRQQKQNNRPQLMLKLPPSQHSGRTQERNPRQSPQPRPESDLSLEESKRMSGLGFHWPRPPSMSPTPKSMTPPMTPSFPAWTPATVRSRTTSDAALPSRSYARVPREADDYFSAQH